MDPNSNQSRRQTWNPYSSASPYQSSSSNTQNTPTSTSANLLACPPARIDPPPANGASPSAQPPSSSQAMQPSSATDSDTRPEAQPVVEQPSYQHDEGYRGEQQPENTQGGKQKNWLKRGWTKLTKGIKNGWGKFNENPMHAYIALDVSFERWNEKRRERKERRRAMLGE
jgi:hypothetical protein